MTLNGRYLVITTSAATFVLDTNSDVVVSQLSISLAIDVAIFRDGLIYVTATNILYELAPDGTLYRGSAISLSALPGKPVIVSDSFGNLRAVMVNQSPSFGGSALIVVDLGTRNVSYAFQSGVIFTTLVPVSASRVLALSNTQQLYDITLPAAIQLASFTGLTNCGILGNHVQ